MKTRTTITELTHDDLVSLLCTATYGSNWLEICCPYREGIEISGGDCREDIWAKALISGKPVACIDHNAEGEIYGQKGNAVESDDGDGSVCYLIYMQDIIEGLQSALDGTYHDTADCKDWARQCATDFIEGDIDNPEAECLMQVIMFNDVIY